MDDKKDTGFAHYSCEECCANIASSNPHGISTEVDEYVYYFCGRECYDKWKNRTGCCSDTEKT